MTAVAMRLLASCASAVWRFLRTPYGQIVAVVVIFGGLAWWHGERRYSDGVMAERGRWEARLAASTAKAHAKEAKNAEASQEVEKAVAVKQTEIRWRTEYLTKEVVRYVPIDPGRPSLGVGFVRLHDAAALGQPVSPDPAGRTDEAPSGVTDPALAETVIWNYGACHSAIEQVKGWQDWWAKVSAP